MSAPERLHESKLFLRRFHWSVPTVVLTGLFLTGLMFWEVRQAELDSFRTRLESDVALRTDTIINKIDDSILVSKALHIYFNASDQLTPGQFRALSLPFLHERNELKALSWNPCVPLAQKSSFEDQVRKNIAAGFSLYERGENGKQLPAGNRSFYYPVLYIEPLSENQKAVGFDVGSNPVRRAALERARDTGEPAATERIRLVQDTEELYSILVFTPVFGKGLPVSTVEERRKALQGFTVAVINIEKLLTAALGKTKPIGLPFDLLDLSAPPDKQLLHRWLPRLKNGSSWVAGLLPTAPGTLRKFTFCGREWGLKLTPSQTYLERNYPLAYWLLLPTGILLSVLMGLYFRNLYSQRQKLEELVLERTAELQSSEENLRELNTHLEERVNNRTKQLEAANLALQQAKELAETIGEEQNTIVELATTGIVFLRQRVVDRCNRKLEEIFGYASGELIGKPTRVWYPDQQAYSTIGNEVYEQMKQGEMLPREQQLVRKDGSLFWARLFGQAVDNSDPIKGAVIIIDDITAEREAIETLREAKEAAEAANRAKSVFLANMSHEIRTPLNAVLGFSQIVLHDPTLSEENRRNLQTVNRSGEHLLTLINDVLDMAKIESGRMLLEQVPFDLPDLLAEICDMFTPRAASKELQLLHEPHPSLPRYIVGDAGKLRQIVINLLGNAIKFTSKGGIALRVREGS